MSVSMRHAFTTWYPLWCTPAPPHTNPTLTLKKDHLLYCFFNPLDNPVISNSSPFVTSFFLYCFKLSPSHNLFSNKSLACLGSNATFCLHHVSGLPKALYVKYSLSALVNVLLFNRLQHHRQEKRTKEK